jgi:hypothetical protein
VKTFVVTMNKSTRSTSLPAGPVLGGGLKGDGGTRGVSQRGSGEEKEIEVRRNIYFFTLFSVMKLIK